MGLLIINTLPEDDVDANEAVKLLTADISDYKVINTSGMNISHCVGCKTCMFQTPGVCCLKDDYKKIEPLYFEYSDVVVICGTSLNFLDYKAIRLLQRRFPFAVIFCENRAGKIRHVLRYNNKLRIGLLYKGDLDNQMLNKWLDLYVCHSEDISIGAFSIKNAKELCKCI